jgi:hypothetical protein
VEYGLIYVEYISRRPGVGIKDFHAAVIAAQTGWDTTYAEDQLLLSAGRTWRLGPEPEYVHVWYSPGCGLDRIDAWERIFRSGEADHQEGPAQRVMRIDRAGCYQPLQEPIVARGGPYYAEFFEARGTPAAVKALYGERASRYPQLTLNLLAHRIGHLAPDPGGLAVWSAPSFAALVEIAQEGERLTGDAGPVRLISAGSYADTGQEIL